MHRTLPQATRLRENMPNPAQAPSNGNPAKAGNRVKVGQQAPTQGQSGAASQDSKAAATGAAADAQQAQSAAKETVPVLPSDRTVSQQAKLIKSQLPRANLLSEHTAGPQQGDCLIMELADGRCITAPIAEIRGNSMVVDMDDRGLQWLEESPDHSHLKIQGSGPISAVAMSWNGMCDALDSDTAQGWAQLFDRLGQTAESALRWSRIWRQQHAALGDHVTHEDQRNWEADIAALMQQQQPTTQLSEQQQVVRRILDVKDPVMLKIWFDARRKQAPLIKFSRQMSIKAGHEPDHYWRKIRALVNEQADLDQQILPMLQRVLGRKLLTNPLTGVQHQGHKLRISTVTVQGLQGNEELECEQALFAAGLPIKRVTIEPRAIVIELKPVVDEDSISIPNVPMNVSAAGTGISAGVSGSMGGSMSYSGVTAEDTSDPYSQDKRYYIVRRNSPTVATPGIAGFHTIAAARAKLATMPHSHKYQVRAIDRQTLPYQHMTEAEYQGRKVKLGRPIRTSPGQGGKFKVYVRDPKTGNIKMVRFGDTTGLSIKRDDPERRRNFRARHHCDNPGPRTKARFWSCKMWTRKPVGQILKGK